MLLPSLTTPIHSTGTGIDPLSTMRSETVAVGCHRLPIGLFEPFSGQSHLLPVATATEQAAVEALERALEPLRRLQQDAADGDDSLRTSVPAMHN